MRGEYICSPHAPPQPPELPPHARRIRRLSRTARRTLGTTSACAENTLFRRPVLRSRWNYLRMRGEYANPYMIGIEPQELPPHARRIPPPALCLGTRNRTTSACAENTFELVFDCAHLGNYLRMRGEYAGNACALFRLEELPPHARRILFPFKVETNIFGTTSACAENTHLLLYMLHTPRNYLRMRGEYLVTPRSLVTPRELPPHARRIRDVAAYQPAQGGTTSACAENTNQKP